MYYKRMILSDENYLSSTMSGISTTANIEKTKVNDYVNSFMKNISLSMQIGIHLKINDVLDSLKTSCLADFVSKCRIDSDAGIYKKDFVKYPFEIENALYKRKGYEINFEKFIDTINFHINFPPSIYLFGMKKEVEEDIFLNFSDKIFINKYAFIVERILEIETILCQIHKDSPQNVLLKLLGENHSEFIDDIILTLYFYLYDENTGNIRNRFMHGSALTDNDFDYTIYKIMSLVYLSMSLKTLLEEKNGKSD